MMVTAVEMIKVLTALGSLGSSVSIAKGWMARVQFTSGKRVFFSAPHCPD
jgi:hypothetical protein